MKKNYIFLLVFLSLFAWNANSQVTSYPFTEGFEGSTFPPTNWSQSQQSGTTNWTSKNGNQNTSVSAYAGSLNAYFYTSSRGSRTQLITPAMDISSVTNPRLVFWHSQVEWSGDQDTLGVYYRTTATGSWTLLASYANQVTSWTERTIDLPNASTTYYIAFEATSDYGRGVTIDEFKVETTPTCLTPNALAVSSITNDSASLGWTENNSATSWQIEWDTTGFTPGTGNSFLTSANPYTLTGLSANTGYDYYVRSICTAGDTSARSSARSFTTSCAVFTVPYFEGFESGQTQNGMISGCVSQESTSGSQTWTANNTLTNYNRTPRTGSWNAYLRFGNDDWLFIPVDLVGGTTYTAEVYASQDGSGTSNSNVGISYGTADDVASMTNTIVASTGINSTAQQLRGAFTPAASGTYYVGINGYMNFSPWYISIDDISIVQCNTTTSTDTQTACDSYTWMNGVTYTASNSTAKDTLVNVAGCDSIISLNLTINNSNTGTAVISECNSYHTWIDGITYTASNNSATFTVTNAAGCDSVVTLDLTINSLPSTDVQSACVTYTWTNSITYTANNNTATDTFVNAAGCDSIVTLNLTIGSETSIDVQSACATYTWTDGETYTADNFTALDTFTNVGGCDSIVTLNFTILASTVTDVVTACDTFTWQNGVLYTSNNTSATVTLTNVLGCDSVVTLDLTILNSSNPSFEVATACGSYTWNGTTYTSSNFVDEATFTNVNGCDSTVRLRLTILSESASTDVISACNSYYTWVDGVTYTASNNTATYTYTNAAGCDSVVTLDLTISSPPTTDVIVSCNSYYTWTDGVTYYSDNNTATDTIINAAGCDSVVTLDLTFTSTGTVDTRVACDTFTWTNGVLYSSNNNTATDTFTNAAGCDSVVTLNLTMNYTSFTVDAITTCDSYTWINGVTYTTTNFFARDTISSSNGCDSIVRLNLTINYSSATTDVVNACGSYFTWVNGTTYYTDNSAATFTYTNVSGCDSVVTLDLTIGSPATTDVIVACDNYTWTNGETYSANNNTAVDTFTNAAGCDSVVYLDLTINQSSGSTDTYAVCSSLTWLDGVTYTSNNNNATFTYTNAVGCDSIVTLDLTILSNSTSEAIVACDNYTWIDGVTYTTSNNAATFTYTNSFGCDSVISLDLVINNTVRDTNEIVACDSYTWTDGVTYTASNNTALDTFASSTGCDSIVLLDLTLNFANTGSETITACDEYTWNGTTYTASTNTATATFTNTAGCDSIVTLNLTINNSIATTDAIQACNSYTWINGFTYTVSNSTATITLTNVAGCDSIVTLDLTILNSTTGLDVITACDNYTWIDGRTYTASNTTATSTLTNVAGCDSIVTLNLTINNSASSTDIIVACDAYTWTNGVTYTASNNVALDTFQTVLGCDSIVTLDLTINNSNASTDVISACNNYTWVNGKIYTSSNNTATYTYTNVNGCDSVVSLDLTITYRTLGTAVVEACGSYTWNGITYTENEFRATDTLVNSTGCDSIVTLNLTILETSSSTDVVKACGAYTWIDGISYTASNNSATFVLTNAIGCDSVVSLDLDLTVIDVSITQADPTLEAVVIAGATYQWIDCDNDDANIEGATSNQYRATENGNYAVGISANGCVDTSDCVTVAKASVFESSIFNEVLVYPNPTNGVVNVDLGSLTQAVITVYDLTGTVIYKQANIPADKFQFNLEAAAGMYIVEILSNGQTMRSRLIKK
jgi:hypothetical protein